MKPEPVKSRRNARPSDSAPLKYVVACLAAPMLLCFLTLLKSNMSSNTGLGLIGVTAIGGGAAIARWKVPASRRYGVVWKAHFAAYAFACLGVFPIDPGFQYLGFLSTAVTFFILHAVIGLVMTISLWLSSRVIHKPT